MYINACLVVVMIALNAASTFLSEGQVYFAGIPAEFIRQAMPLLGLETDFFFLKVCSPQASFQHMVPRQGERLGTRL